MAVCNNPQSAIRTDTGLPNRVSAARAQHGVPKFGQFKLKSGHLSLYFFNLGLISTDAALRESVALLRAAGAQPVATAIALDRQKPGPHRNSRSPKSSVSRLGVALALDDFACENDVFEIEDREVVIVKFFGSRG